MRTPRGTGLSKIWVLDAVGCSSSDWRPPEPLKGPKGHKPVTDWSGFNKLLLRLAKPSSAKPGPQKSVINLWPFSQPVLGNFRKPTAASAQHFTEFGRSWLQTTSRDLEATALVCWVRAVGGVWRLCCHPVPDTLLHQQADVAAPGARGTRSRRRWASTSNLCLLPAALTRDQDHTQRSQGNRHRQVPWQSFSVKPTAQLTGNFLPAPIVGFSPPPTSVFRDIFVYTQEGKEQDKPTWHRLAKHHSWGEIRGELENGKYFQQLLPNMSKGSGIWQVLHRFWPALALCRRWDQMTSCVSPAWIFL